jgi:hypothetical protein
MDELVAQIAANTGVDSAVARRAVGIILKFLLREGQGTKVQELIETIPGASEAVTAAPEIAGGGVMGVFNSLTTAGLRMGDIQGVTREFVAFANAKVGEGTVREIVGSIPGLNQFV